MPELLAIVGPTGSGKTELGLRLAQDQGGEIISVDSRQVYRFLAVGTAKPTGKWESMTPSPRQVVSRGPSLEQRDSLGPPLTPAGDDKNKIYQVAGVNYHLVDIWDPAEPFSAAGFVRLATEKIEEVRRRGKQPILVGGTGLYFKALMEGLAPLPPRDEALRSELQAIAEKRGRPYLHQELARVDPEAAARIPANNIARVTRALEVFKLTQKPISQWHRDHRRSPSAGIRLRCIGIALTKEELNKRIEERAGRMLEQGTIKETQDLLDRGYSEKCPALSGLGYPLVVSFLHGNITKDELRRRLIQDTRRYAKRQMTWFRNQMKVEWKKQ